MHPLGRSVGPCKKYGCLAGGVRGDPGSPPELSVGLPGASGGLPEAPGTLNKPKQQLHCYDDCQKLQEQKTKNKQQT